MLWNWLHRISFTEKATVLKEYLLLKKFFWKGSCSEELPTLEKHTFWIITNSEEVAPQKQ